MDARYWTKIRGVFGIGIFIILPFTSVSWSDLAARFQPLQIYSISFRIASDRKLL